MEMKRRDAVAQWAFDTRPILDRFHLWLEDVEESVDVREGGHLESFVGDGLERAFIMGTAVTALGTRLFGRFGEGREGDKSYLNRVKKDADAVSAYAMSEALWFLSRSLPENHAIMVSLGEGIMPKAGETPEMGSNPLLGFGRVYARPQVAKYLDARVSRLLNEDNYGWQQFWDDIKHSGIRIWGAAVDTLENTSRFAKGAKTGPMAVLHLFDQPLQVAKPYEGYVGNLILPRQVVQTAEQRSILISYHTSRRKVLDAIQETYPEVKPENVHVWTLGGKSRISRLQGLWDEWKSLGVHIIEDGWQMPGGGPIFTESGTYAPIYRVGLFEGDDKQPHLFICDGYAASAEAIQGASLDPVLDTDSSLCLFSSSFKLPYDKEQYVMKLDPEDVDFADKLKEYFGDALDDKMVDTYRLSIKQAREAAVLNTKHNLKVDDFFPNKDWRVLSLAGYMLDDPYTGCPGIETLGPSTYRVTVNSSTRRRIQTVSVTLRLKQTLEDSRLVFSPLLDRFYAGQDYKVRPVKISDSGRIRNELQTLCSEALEHRSDEKIYVDFDKVDEAVLSNDKKRVIGEVLGWYKENHPIWFKWLEL
jgi:hypothetical protein